MGNSVRENIDTALVLTDSFTMLSLAFAFLHDLGIVNEV